MACVTSSHIACVTGGHVARLGVCGDARMSDNIAIRSTGGLWSKGSLLHPVLGFVTSPVYEYCVVVYMNYGYDLCLWQIQLSLSDPIVSR